MGAVDVWAQQPNALFQQQPWLATLNRWTRKSGDEPPVTTDRTLAAMDAAGVDITFLSAWCGPRGWLITNDEVAEAVARSMVSA